jgi:hypothetical protein
MLLNSMLSMLDGMKLMAVGNVRMVCGFLMVLGFMMLGGFVVVASSVLMVLGRLHVMMGCFL